MTWSLVSHGETLGRTGAELPGLQPNVRGWHFRPAPAFARVSALLLDVQEATSGLEELMPSPETLASVREDERAAFVRNAMLSDPRAPRFLELMDDVEALALELRDDAGATLPTRTIGVTVLELSPKAFREVLVAIDPAADPALSEVPPFYLLVAGT